MAEGRQASLLVYGVIAKGQLDAELGVRQAHAPLPYGDITGVNKGYTDVYPKLRIHPMELGSLYAIRYDLGHISPNSRS